MSSRKFGRREFARTAAVAATGLTAGCLAETKDEGLPQMRSADERTLPIQGAKVVPTACDYCIVGCGYEAIIWPEGEDDTGDSGASVPWFTPNMHTVVQIGGRAHNVVVRPDPNTTVVNPRGDHSIRGGTLAQKLYSEDRATRDRLKQPLLRVDGKLVPIDWETALDIVSEVSRHVIDEHGVESWGMKQYSYQYYENTYALTKLALGAIRTPTWTLHDKPSAASDTPGLSDAGVNAYSASYQDWADADVIMVSGVSLYDAKSVLFQSWVQAGGAKLVVVNPRKDLTAAYAEKTGGIHLQLIPGTDTVLYNAMARYIIENGWEDREFIERATASRVDIDLETGFRRVELARTFEEYKAFLLDDDASTLNAAQVITGVPAEQIIAAARLLAAPRDGVRPKTSMMLEKGNYWSHNVDNTASYASLGLLVGAGNRPGQVMSRAGGHQRGMLKAAGYPLDLSPDDYNGHKVPLNVDRHVLEDKVRFMWVVGTTWFAASGASQALADHVRRQARQAGPLLTRDKVMAGGRVDARAAAALLRARSDNGGMILVQQEIYENELSGFADLVLPAATWGEADFTRMQGERRLRIYSKIMDPPGDAKPDWWIVAQVAQRMGYEGFDWADANAVFEEASVKSVGSVHDYAALVDLARERGQRGHEFLRSLGTTGIQCPIGRDAFGNLVPTIRLHEDGFSTKSGRAMFVQGSWARVRPVQDELQPGPDQLWVINMRVNALWQSMHDDARIPFRLRRFPVAFIEIHPDDASERGIESGDWVVLDNPRVHDQLGRPHAVTLRAVAYVTDMVKRGVTSAYFNYRGEVSTAVNGLTSGLVDPMNPVYRYKLGRARITGAGPSEYKDSMCFLPLNLV